MARRDARDARRFRLHPAPPRVSSRFGVRRSEPELVRILLCPFQAAALAVDAQLSAFSCPGATWLAHSMPRAPLAKRSSTWALSSSRRPGTNVREIGRELRRASSPVTNSARW